MTLKRLKDFILYALIMTAIYAFVWLLTYIGVTTDGQRICDVTYNETKYQIRTDDAKWFRVSKRNALYIWEYHTSYYNKNRHPKDVLIEELRDIDSFKCELPEPPKQN